MNTAIEITSKIISSILMTSIIVYSWYKFSNKRMNIKSRSNIISIIILSSISILNYYNVNAFVRILSITIILTIVYKYLFKTNIKEAIFTPIYSQFLIMISETIIIILLATILRLNTEDLINMFIANFFINIAISILFCILINLTFIKRIHHIILKYIDKTNNKFYIILLLIIVSIANIITINTYYEIDIRILMTINVSFTLFCFILVLYSFKTQSNYNKVSNKYDIAIKSLNNYEEMMNKYKVDNHENKNILKTIGVMALNNKDTEITKYVESLVKEKYEINDKLLIKMSKIPSGGLRASIYSEILKIQSNNINYELNIDNQIKTIDLIELNHELIIDLCKIIGVVIDNAIDEVKLLDEKYIGISLYIEDTVLNIKVSNNYNKKIEVDKIFNEGYTTKGNNHGYGLPLVKKIIENNKKLEINTELSKEVFSQIISIKFK